jgi:hypothetical protein
VALSYLENRRALKVRKEARRTATKVNLFLVPAPTVSLCPQEPKVVLKLDLWDLKD